MHSSRLKPPSGTREAVNLVRLRRAGSLLRHERNCVELLARNAFRFSEPVRRKHDGDEARAPRQARVRVVAGVVAEKRHAGHHLDAICERPIEIPGSYLSGRVTDSRETRHAIVVQRECIGVVGDAGMQLRHERNIGALVAHLVDATQDQRLDVARIAAAGLEPVHETRHQFLRLHVREPAVGPRLAARRAHGVVDVGMCHRCLLSRADRRRSSPPYRANRRC